MSADAAPKPTGHCLVLSTTATEDEAHRIAQQLVRQRLAACVQVQAIRSFYTWNDQACQEPEWQLQIKTREALYPAVEEFLRLHHSYEVPEIIRLPIAGGSGSYLGWIDRQTDG